MIESQPQSISDDDDVAESRAKRGNKKKRCGTAGGGGGGRRKKESFDFLIDRSKLPEWYHSEVPRHTAARVSEQLVTSKRMKSSC